MDVILPEFDLEATEPEICRFLASFVRIRRPRIVTEAGTYRGHSALLMGLACQANNFGHVYTYDPFDHGAQYFIDANGLGDWVTYVEDDYMAQLPNKIEFAFIDASARDETGRMNAAIREIHFNATRERLTPKGIICVHDTLHPSEPWYDGDGGKSMHRIREQCQINLDFMRGLSIHYCERWKT